VSLRLKSETGPSGNNVDRKNPPAALSTSLQLANPQRKKNLKKKQTQKKKTLQNLGDRLPIERGGHVLVSIGNGKKYKGERG